MAEALREVHDPLAAALDAGPDAPGPAVVTGIVAALLPAESGTPPPWLRDDQPVAFRRVHAALARYGGALLADPVGSGKTWVALAVAHALGLPTVVLAPAVLRGQWEGTAARVGVPVLVHSHERASRGALPCRTPGLVIIDESHRFRAPGSRRYRTVAPWLGSARVLLLSATPVVNRLEDLTHQLLLALPDDALLPAGCASLRVALGGGHAPAALGEVVLCRGAPAGLPALTRHRATLPLAPDDRRLLARLDALRLSRQPGIAALLRGGLLAALASSPRAFRRAVERYRDLLAQAADAVAAGRTLPRRTLRQAAGADTAQLVLWALLPDGDGPAEVAGEDETAVQELLRLARAREAAADPRVTWLRALLSDGIPTVVFTGSTATLAWLRARLADLGPAWLAGDGAGIGTARLPRAAVLARYGPAGTGTLPPLLATDVAAEGLDLQRAARVVHYDLPWTATRLAQRAGRVRRLASAHAAVTVVSLLPPPEVERRQRRLERLLGKQRLPGHAGLEERSGWLYRWRADLAPLARGPRAAGATAVPGTEAGWLVAVGLPWMTPGPAPARLLWIGDDGGVTDAPAETIPRLLDARRAAHRPLTEAERRRFPEAVAPALRPLLAALDGERWRAPGRPREQRRLWRRLVRLAGWCARRRDRRGLAAVERGLAWLAGGLRAGEQQRAGAWLALPRPALLAELARLPHRPPAPAAPLPRLDGIVRVATFPACAPLPPSCSTSTAP